jgi:hypothetical protein
MGPEQNRERCERRQEEQHRHGERLAIAPALNAGKMPSTANEPIDDHIVLLGADADALGPA